jgi:hypothetical protein
MKTSLSSVHKDIHVATLEQARRMRYDSAAHARLLALARDARFYFSALRAIGE